MRKKTLIFAIILVMILSLFGSTSSASNGKWGLEDVPFTDARGNHVTIPGGAKSCATWVVSFTPGSPWTRYANNMDTDATLGVPDGDTSGIRYSLTLGAGGVLVLGFDIYIYDGDGNDIYVFEEGPMVEATRVEVSEDLINWIYVGDADGAISGVDLSGKVPADGRYSYVRLTDLRTSPTGAYPGAEIDAVAGINVTLYKYTGWAETELERAHNQNLIPEAFLGADLSLSITRAEFAAVAVKVYENLSGKNAIVSATNPFTDTDDIEVLKSYNESLMVGISADRFDPDTLLNREQAATALTRVLKRVYIDGWTFATDSSYTLNYSSSETFADDDKISDWAKPSVYFMAENRIIQGTGNNMFSPRATTPAEQAISYASATREQAIIIGLRLVENLKGKPLDYNTN